MTCHEQPDAGPDLESRSALRADLTLDADVARGGYQRILARFAHDPAAIQLPGSRVLRRRERELEILSIGDTDAVIGRLRAHALETVTTEAMSLEEIFVSTVRPGSAHA